MPPSTEDRLADILDFAAEIEDILKDVDYETFRAKRRVRHLVERYLEMTCEAALKLPDRMKTEATAIDWRKMNNFANVLRHAYHTTRIDLLWDIVHDQLPSLKAFAESRIRE
ncbi:DUF86 domain-containing protein [Rhodopseudomonas boonkerdii]|uniref:HepT-like ribonuclease domain-containing protein n=1 Tax=Rhodopseudomonas boonkerdii TaxID=475937 RepID=UPI001E5CF581|nr:HepT-like ribonuclease domain-containing protein [Rhodopseudomonas boonkerdii]UGV27394.1 DUF86 domain-containing protein [Rhodopseudomonas boonkerdii]